MFIGSTSGQATTFTSHAGKSEPTVAAPQKSAGAPAGAIVSSEAAPFINPAVNYDYKAGMAVFVIRDGETGEVKSQYPSKKVVEEYQRHGASTPEAKPVDVKSAGQPDTGTPATVAVTIPAPAAPTAPTPAPAPTSSTDQIA